MAQKTTSRTIKGVAEVRNEPPTAPIVEQARSGGEPMRFVFARKTPDGSEPRIECLRQGPESGPQEVFLSQRMLRSLGKGCYCQVFGVVDTRSCDLVLLLEKRRSLENLEMRSSGT